MGVRQWMLALLSIISVGRSARYHGAGDTKPRKTKSSGVGLLGSQWPNFPCSLVIHYGGPDDNVA
jgi:hypothetical protein